MNIVLVGGGNAAVAMLDHFLLFREHRILGIADIRADAPGMVRARQLGIETSLDMNTLVQRPETDMVVEITGRPEVQEAIRSVLRPSQHLLPAECAKLMSDLIDAQNRRNAEVTGNLTSTFLELTARLENTTENIDASFRTIARLLREGSLISINATIEAARAGDAGKPFEIVVHRIAEMVAQIRDAADAIDQASQETHGTLQELGRLERFMQESFSGDGQPDVLSSRDTIPR